MDRCAFVVITRSGRWFWVECYDEDGEWIATSEYGSRAEAEDSSDAALGWLE